MCGIFGLVLGSDSGFTGSEIKLALDYLFKLSESRGKEAAGIACNSANTIYVAKYDVPASQMIKRQEYKDIYKMALNGHASEGGGVIKFPISLIGHSRLVTNGGQQVHANNQPAIASGMVAIHNGIITNVDELWKRFPSLKKSTDLDTEILLNLIRKFRTDGDSLIGSVQRAYNLIEGVASVAMFFDDLNNLLLSTNNGSLYLGTSNSKNVYVFASERYILERLVRLKPLRTLFNNIAIGQVRAGSGYLLNLDSLHLDKFAISPDCRSPQYESNVSSVQKNIIDVTSKKKTDTIVIRMPGEGPYVLSSSFVDEYPQNQKAVAGLRRCTRCVLPETMPFIEFDQDGVCNYCHNYKPIGFLGIDALRNILEPHRKNNGEPDCLVTFSGGRDSSYGIHVLTTVLDMVPITYTYDWGMVTDLARRNQMRVCGKLGLEHILVSANIAKKRKNIRKNVLAWLRQPDLGTIPLFMAGDKQYFYYANKVSQQTGVNITFLGENLLEITQFKVGFCGIAPRHGSRHAYSISLLDKMQLARYYGSRYVTNLAYLNSSLVDTMGSYLSYYFIPHDYINIYEYIKWDENEINRTLINEYNWETDPGTTTTWRIGDGTAAFYNYIYYSMAGLTENDTFRSNQIREGMLDREQALKLVDKENEPRYDSMQWYCDVIGIDFEETVRRINSAPKLYM